MEFFDWQLPPIVGKDKALADALFTAHMVVSFAIVALLVVHIGAALKHGIVKKDGVLQRML